MGLALLLALLAGGSARRQAPAPAEVFGRIQPACPGVAPEGGRRRMDHFPDFTIQWVDAFPGVR